MGFFFVLFFSPFRSSWGTISLVFPLILPSAHAVARCNTRIFYGTIASILSGSVLGDHVSILSDTSVLAAVACRCDLVAHIKTQLPYAAVCAVVGVVVGDLATGYGLYPDWAGLAISCALLLLLVFLLGTPVDQPGGTSWLGWLCRGRRSGRSGQAGALGAGEDVDSNGRGLREDDASSLNETLPLIGRSPHGVGAARWRHAGGSFESQC